MSATPMLPIEHIYQTNLFEAPPSIKRVGKDRVIWPVSWTESSLPKGPNRHPFKAVLFRSDVPSVRTPLGGRRPVRIHPIALKKLDLNKLVGLPIHVVPTLDHHWIEGEDEGAGPQFISIGTVVSAELVGDGDAVIGEGYLWDRDFPELVKMVSEAGQQGVLAVSWEIVDVEIVQGEDFDWIVRFEPVGFAFLKAQHAAYHDRMPVLAALADKEHYDPAKLELAVLLDDHRLLHAYYSTLQSGSEVGDWTIKEVVEFHARVVDEMFKRHVSHNRGEGVSRKLNDESLPKQKFKFYTNEIEKDIVGFMTIDASMLETLSKHYYEHEPLTIDKRLVAELPEGKPFYIADEERIYGIGAYAEIDGKTYLSVQHLYGRPLSRSKIEARLDEFKANAGRAMAVFAKLPQVIVVPNFIAVTGSSLLAEKPNDLDLLMLDNAKFSRITSQIAPLFQVPIEITVTDQPAGLAIPVYDLILVKRDFVGTTRPPVDEDDLRLAPIPTVKFRDGFIARRIRALGDDESGLYAPLAFATQAPIKRTLLSIAEGEESLWVTDEDEHLEVPETMALTDNCKRVVAEVWITDDGLSVADVLFWNATSVALLPFLWRRRFIAKVASMLGMNAVNWIPFATEQALKMLVERYDAVVVQDGQSLYGVGRWLVMKGGK